eukprot:5069407-Pyramimonas_sp.AAC.1
MVLPDESAKQYVPGALQGKADDLIKGLEAAYESGRDVLARNHVDDKGQLAQIIDDMKKAHTAATMHYDKIS